MNTYLLLQGASVFVAQTLLDGPGGKSQTRRKAEAQFVSHSTRIRRIDQVLLVKVASLHLAAVLRAAFSRVQEF
jgi:hypothetical protein